MKFIHSIISAIALALTLTATSAAPIITTDPAATTPADGTTGHLPVLNIGPIGVGRRADPEAFVVRPEIVIR
ncbi:hypothetical protein BGZ82_006474 [Podila clonocystis]|nr:hypothetical protein BGZ82_006474 [Podila clonocystis]